MSLIPFHSILDTENPEIQPTAWLTEPSYSSDEENFDDGFVVSDQDDSDEESMRKPLQSLNTNILPPKTRQHNDDGAPHVTFDDFVDDMQVNWSDCERDYTQEDFAPGCPTGPRNIPDNASTPIDIFKLFFSTYTVTHIVRETNNFMSFNSIGRVCVTPNPISNDEFIAFIGVVLAMGLVQKGDIKDYWKTSKSYWIGYTPGISLPFPRDRFLQILHALHFCDNQNYNVDRSDPSYDRLWKIRPMFDQIVPRFRHYYVPMQSICTDESMVLWKGKLGFRQMMPAKPISCGIKLFTLAESRTGYVLNTDVYTGKAFYAYDRVAGLSTTAALKMIDPYLDKNYVVYMDNYYTSIPLFVALLERKTMACGTLRRNRKHIPKSFADKRLERQMDIGQTIYKSSGQLTCLAFRDSKLVLLLSSQSSDRGFEEQQRKRRRKPGAAWEQVLIRRPNMIANYNANMGGVDQADQRVSSHQRHFQSNRWYKGMFMHLLWISVANAFRIYSVINVRTGSGMTYDSFIERLSMQCIGDKRYRKTPCAEHFVSSPPCPTRGGCNPALRHAPAKIGPKKTLDCVLPHDGRRFRTSWKCSGCNIPMCAAPCFGLYHYPE